ncbi:MAG: hypothetical protein HC820_01380 [Hydrococcus sp. RM1_1_31]|nr:hypothetical protein [Hydrococcus sp. RM1_1_31]
MAEQLSLFDLQEYCSEIEKKPTSPSQIKWSYSRRNILEQCSRKYYYQYYGANKNTAKAELNKPKLAILKNLTNRHIVAGLILHNRIRRFINQLQRGESLSLKYLLDQAIKDYRQQLGYSKWQKNRMLILLNYTTNLKMYINY